MTAPKIRISTIVRLALGIGLLCGVALAQTPVLFFSDLTFGPNSGWNNGSSQGAAVTVWGKNFGSTQGSSYVTIGGAKATSYAEWDVIGPARSLERITFFIPTTAATGSGTISVTVNGVTSNTIPFAVDNTTPIYYVDVTNGNNSNNGRSTSTAWKDVPQADESVLGDNQYIVYIRAGTYTTVGTFCGYSAYLGENCSTSTGSSTKQKAYIGYPGDAFPVLSSAEVWSGEAAFTSAIHNNYYTFAKIESAGGSGSAAAFSTTIGNYNRFVGMYLHDFIDTVSETGILTPVNSPYTELLGNHLYHNGCDSYKHDIYLTSWYDDGSNGGVKGAASQNVEIAWNEIDTPTWVSGCGYNDAHGISLFLSSHASSTANATGNIWVHHNYFHDGNDGFMEADDGAAAQYGMYFYDNIFTAGTVNNASMVGSLFFEPSCSSAYIYANTFGLAQGASTTDAYDYSSGCAIQSADNIYLNQASQPFWGPVTGSVVSDHDLYYPSSNPLPSSSGMTVTNASQANPDVVNAVADGDFHLTSNSPQAGGSNLTSALSSLPFGLYDYDGVQRPNSAWAQGAYQYTGAQVAQPPNPPSGLAAVVH